VVARAVKTATSRAGEKTLIKHYLNGCPMQAASENSSVSSEPSVADVLSCISQPKVLSLFKAVAISDNDRGSKILISKLGFSRMKYYLSMEKLMHVGLVRRINGRYSLTSLGKVLFSSYLKIETAIQYYWKLQAIDPITMAAETKGLPTMKSNLSLFRTIEKNLSLPSRCYIEH
jgi:predicted transcriptional regulator